LLAENNSHTNNQLAITSSTSVENDKLKGDIGNLNEKIRDLKRDLAFYITDLDLAHAGLRVFTCCHDTFNTIPDGKNSTREKGCGIIANDGFLDFANDPEFMKEYNDARAVVLNHHRAHERINQGRGDWSGHLKDELYRVDHKRGVLPTYY
jgi:hypothetical protein